MKKKIMLSALFVFGLPLIAAACPNSGKGKGDCPFMMEGVKVEKKDLKNGVRITITSEDGKTVEKIKKMVEMKIKMRGRKCGDCAKHKKMMKKHMKKKMKYVCPMDGYESDKPGKCPKCGMKLHKKEMKEKMKEKMKSDCPMKGMKEGGHE